MKDFNLNLSTEIIFGKGKESQIGEILKRDKIKKVLFIYGSSSIKSTGLYNRIISFLNDAKIEFVEYGGIESNPLLSDANSAVKIGKEQNVHGVLAVGGGSVMDTAKVVAAGILLTQNIWDFFTGLQITKALPIYNIVTLAATGSEMNSGFVITNHETKEKLGMGSPFTKPKVSILNPELTFSVPPNYTSYGAIDIFAHIIEGYLTGTNVPNIINRLKESLIKTVIECTNIILQNPNDYDARAEFMWAATMALNGSTSMGIEGANSPNHMIEHGISGVHQIPHGAGLSIVIPAWMKWYKNKNPKQFLRLSKEIFGKDRIDEGIDEIERWFHSLGSPIRLNEYNIFEENIPLIVEKSFKQGELWGMSGSYTEEVIGEILHLAIDPDFDED